MHFINFMSQFFHTIRFRLILAFGISVFLMLATGLFGLQGMSKLSGDVQSVYSGNTVPIGQLGAVRASALELRRLLWQIQATHDKPLTAKVRDSAAQLDTLWHAYYPSRISSAPERAAADKIDGLLIRSQAAIDHELAMIDNDDYDAAAQFQKTVILPLDRQICATFNPCHAGRFLELHSANKPTARKRF